MKVSSTPADSRAKAACRRRGGTSSGQSARIAPLSGGWTIPASATRPATTASEVPSGTQRERDERQRRGQRARQQHGALAVHVHQAADEGRQAREPEGERARGDAALGVVAAHLAHPQDDQQADRRVRQAAHQRRGQGPGHLGHREEGAQRCRGLGGHRPRLSHAAAPGPKGA